MIKLIETLKDGGWVPTGSLRKLMNAGMISTKIIGHYEIYKYFDAQFMVMRGMGYSKTKAKSIAITYAADKSGYSELHIRRIIKTLGK